MRRRSSRDSTKTYKALLDAFVDSLRLDDLSLSRSLHQVIVLADPTGRLCEMAEEYAEASRPGWLLSIQGARMDGIGKFDDNIPGVNMEPPSLDDLDEYLGLSNYSLSNTGSPINQSYPDSSSLANAFGTFPQMPQDTLASSSSSSSAFFYLGPQQQVAETEEAIGSVRDTLSENRTSKEDLKAYLQAQLENRQLETRDLPIFSCDVLVADPTDSISINILGFRDGARQAISSGIAIDKVLESSKPDLTLMFRDRQPTDPHTAWSWACDFSKSYHQFSFPLRLATAYITGIQMRVGGDPANAATKSNHQTVLHQPLRGDFR